MPPLISGLSRLCLLVTVLMLALAKTARAEEEPLWEAGIGLAGLAMPDYRGSDEQRGYLLPFPYFVYRGEIIKVDREGITSRLFSSERVTLDLSVDAGVPVRSDKNTARQGMRDLDPTFEVGPELEICLWADCRSGEKLTLRLPVRAVFATDFTHIDGAGWVVNPHVNYDNPRLLPAGWRFSLASGPIFASRANHEYFYGVPAAYATPARPAYEARGGYSGWRALVTTSRRFDQFWFGAFARYDGLSGAEFEDSPLVRQRHAFMAGFGVSWILGKSERLVPAGR